MKHCGVHTHLPNCRPSRPLCKLMRQVKWNQRPCDCGGYRYPHRVGGGKCLYSPKTQAQLEGAPF